MAMACMDRMVNSVGLLLGIVWFQLNGFLQQHIIINASNWNHRIWIVYHVFFLFPYLIWTLYQHYIAPHLNSSASHPNHPYTWIYLTIIHSQLNSTAQFTGKAQPFCGNIQYHKHRNKMASHWYLAKDRGELTMGEVDARRGRWGCREDLGTEAPRAAERPSPERCAW